MPLSIPNIRTSALSAATTAVVLPAGSAAGGVYPVGKLSETGIERVESVAKAAVRVLDEAR